MRDTDLSHFPGHEVNSRKHAVVESHRGYTLIKIARGPLNAHPFVAFVIFM